MKNIFPKNAAFKLNQKNVDSITNEKTFSTIHLILYFPKYKLHLLLFLSINNKFFSQAKDPISMEIDSFIYYLFV